MPGSMAVPHGSGLLRVVQAVTHLDAAGHARMVDVTEKQPTVRSATALVSSVMFMSLLRVVVQGVISPRW